MIGASEFVPLRVDDPTGPFVACTGPPVVATVVLPPSPIGCDVSGGVVATGAVVAATGGLRILSISACRVLLPVSTVGPLTDALLSVAPPLDNGCSINAASA
jgi:hypothetical protein